LQTLQELGAAVAVHRKLLGLQQGDVATQAGITPESLSRFERGRVAEFGSRKLLAVLAVLGAELEMVTQGQAGNLDQLRRERAQPTKDRTGGALGALGEGKR
jgi:transcriptional regulator with XRE-family HTH domain